MCSFGLLDPANHPSATYALRAAVLQGNCKAQLEENRVACAVSIQHNTCAASAAAVAPDIALQGDRKAELEKNRQAFFVSIAAGKDIPIDLLKKHVKKAKTLPGNKVDNTKQGVVTFEDAFKM